MQKWTLVLVRVLCAVPETDPIFRLSSVAYVRGWRRFQLVSNLADLPVENFTVPHGSYFFESFSRCDATERMTCESFPVYRVSVAAFDKAPAAYQCNVLSNKSFKQRPNFKVSL